MLKNNTGNQKNSKMLDIYNNILDNVIEDLVAVFLASELPG